MGMEIETKLGTLIAESAIDENYPGIYLSIRRDGKTFGICLLEVEQWDPNFTPELAVHVWDPDAVWDDPIFNMHTPADVVDKMFKEE